MKVCSFKVYVHDYTLTNTNDTCDLPQNPIFCVKVGIYSACAHSTYLYFLSCQFSSELYITVTVVTVVLTTFSINSPNITNMYACVSDEDKTDAFLNKTCLCQGMLVISSKLNSEEFTGTHQAYSDHTTSQYPYPASVSRFFLCCMSWNLSCLAKRNLMGFSEVAAFRLK